MPITTEILQGCVNNNNYCQEQVYKHYYGFLYHIGQRYINDSSDIKMMVNESFFKVFKNIASYDQGIPFEIWIRKIMINTCIDFLRKTKKEKFKVSIQDDNQTYSTADRNSTNYAEITIEAAHLEDMLTKVPSTSRKVFCLFAIEGYSHKEIALQLDINEGTSKWHVNNARKLLKEQLNNFVKKTTEPVLNTEPVKLNIV